MSIIPIQTIQPIFATWCFLSKDTRSQIQDLSTIRNREQTLTNLAKLINFATHKTYFTNKNIRLLLKCNERTAIKYTVLLKQFDVLRIIKRTKSDLEKKNEKKFALKNQDYLSDLYTLFLMDLRCPKLINKHCSLVKNLKSRHKNIIKEIDSLDGKQHNTL